VSAKRIAHSVLEAAAAVGVSRATLYRRIKDGTVRTFTWGGRRLIRDDDLQAAIDAASGRAPEGQHDGGDGRTAEA
jgi:excisionase family DNA binding protein